MCHPQKPRETGTGSIPWQRGMPRDQRNSETSLSATLQGQPQLQAGNREATRRNVEKKLNRKM